MTKRIPDWLLLLVWRALLGEIYPAIRAIAISLSADKTLLIRYYLDREPNEFDKESLDMVATNIGSFIGLSGDIACIETESILSNEPIRKLDCLDGLVYGRREYEMDT